MLDKCLFTKTHFVLSNCEQSRIIRILTEKSLPLEPAFLRRTLLQGSVGFLCAERAEHQNDIHPRNINCHDNCHMGASTSDVSFLAGRRVIDCVRLLSVYHPAGSHAFCIFHRPSVLTGTRQAEKMKRYRSTVNRIQLTDHPEWRGNPQTGTLSVQTFSSAFASRRRPTSKFECPASSAAAFFFLHWPS